MFRLLRSLSYMTKNDAMIFNRFSLCHAFINRQTDVGHDPFYKLSLSLQIRGELMKGQKHQIPHIQSDSEKVQVMGMLSHNVTYWLLFLSLSKVLKHEWEADQTDMMRKQNCTDWVWKLWSTTMWWILTIDTWKGYPRSELDHWGNCRGWSQKYHRFLKV